METLIQDVRYSFRLLFKTPGFTFITILTLAIGIGANSAVFSVINALLLKPFPFENLDALVSIREQLPGQGMKATAVSPADYFDWREQNNVFDNIAAYRVRDIALTGSGEPELVRGAFVTNDLFPALKINSFLGRSFTADEEEPGRDGVAVLGYGFWQRRLASDPEIVGKSITLSGTAATIIGVMPEHFDFPYATEVWLPLALTPEQKTQRDVRRLNVLASLKDGVTVNQARAEMQTIAQRIEKQHPKTNARLTIHVNPLRDLQADFSRPMLSILLGMAAFLMLIACANVANLLLAHATARRKEIAIRSALCASRGRIIRQLMTESLTLSFFSCLIGLLLAVWAIDLIRASLPPDVLRFVNGWNAIRLDVRVLLFTIAIALATTFLFGLAPALQASRADLNAELKESGRSQTSGSRERLVQSLLVAAELSLALVLLAGAGLMVNGFWRILRETQAPHSDNILTMRTTLPDLRYSDKQKAADFYGQVVERLSNAPEVRMATAGSNTPLNNSPNPSVELIIEGHPPLRAGERQIAELVVIGPKYFELIGLSLMAGRDFQNSDDGKAAPVAVISSLTARRYWPNEDPVGKRFKRSDADASAPWITVVGIVKDVRQSWFDREIRPQVYLPYLQAPQTRMSLLVRTHGDPMRFASAARSHVFAVDSDQPIDEIKSLSVVYRDEASPLRFAAGLMLVFGALALVLSAIGVYGVLSYSVARRTHEIGVRTALGAQPGQVLRLILQQGMKSAAVGLGAGLLLAIALGRVMSSLMFGVVALEYSVLAVFVALLAAVAFLSSYVPAHRAAQVDPVITLRYE